MKLMRIIRNGIAGVMIGVVPVSTAIAATRPSAAVPVAGSTVVAAQADDSYGSGMSIGWPAVAVMAAALIVGLWIVLDDDDDGEGALSRA